MAATGCPASTPTPSRAGCCGLTWQVNRINKFTANLDRVFKDRYRLHDANTDVDSGASWLASPLYYTATAKWTSTISSRLLFEAGYSSNVVNPAWRDSPDTPGPEQVATGRGPHVLRPHRATTTIRGSTVPPRDPWYQSNMRQDIETA